MFWIRTIALAALLGGSSLQAMASQTHGGESSSRGVVSAWVAHLNFYYPGLNASATEVGASDAGADGSAGVSMNQTLEELYLLEGHLRGEGTLPQGALRHIACGRPVCDGGGDGGRCRTCY